MTGTIQIITTSRHDEIHMDLVISWQFWRISKLWRQLKNMIGTIIEVAIEISIMTSIAVFVAVVLDQRNVWALGWELQVKCFIALKLIKEQNFVEVLSEKYELFDNSIIVARALFRESKTFLVHIICCFAVSILEAAPHNLFQFSIPTVRWKLVASEASNSFSFYNWNF